MKFPYELSKERLSLLNPEDKKIYEYEHSGLCPELKLIIEGSKKTVIKNDEGKIVPDTCPKCGGEIVVQIKGEPIYVCDNCGEYYGTVPFHLHESIKNAVNNENTDDENLTLEDIQDFVLDDEYTELEKQLIKSMLDEMLFESEFDSLFDKELIDEVGEEEYNNIKKLIFEYIENDPELKPLYEAEGMAADFWMKGVGLPGMGWLGKLAGGLLTGLLGVVAWLLMKGKDRLALKKLKQYMNKLVELTDSGVNKKRPWYSFLMPTKKGKRNTGDYDKACFRTMQETAERNMACLYSKAIHDLGYLTPGSNSFNKVVSGMMPLLDSGLSIFNKIVSNMSEKAEETNINVGDVTRKLIPFKMDTTLFENVHLPSIPTNYGMLMSNIDYPTKANENPNGSLFMKPTKEILQSAGSDLGTAYFNKDTNLDTIMNYLVNDNKKVENESLLRNSALQSLLEVEGENGLDKSKSVSISNVVTSDMDGDILGSNLELETKKREETKVTTFKGNLVDAIDNYIIATTSRIENLIKSICSEGANISDFKKTIHTLIDAADGNSEKYMKKHNEILKTIMDNSYLIETKLLKAHIEIASKAAKIIGWIHNPQIAKEIGIKRTIVEFEQDLTHFINDNDEDEKGLNIIIDKNSNNCDSYKLLQNIYDKYNKQNNKNENLNYYNYSSYNRFPLFEDEQIKNQDEILLSLKETMEKSYTSFRNELSSKIDDIISQSDPSQWYIIKNTRDRMNKLKEAADKEITAKIELICRTATSANANLGSKFKAAISQHPLRAESLKSVWTRYSDDLTDRIESRIRSIYAANGNSSIFNTVKDFLSLTYPNLIAVMLYYRQYFYLVKLYTSKFPINEKNKKEIEEDTKNTDILWLQASISIAKDNQN